MKTVLHVGCGGQRIIGTRHGFNPDEWEELRLDIDVNVRPDIVGSITHLHRIHNGTIDAVYSSHNIEHLYAHEVPLALGEFRRVLKSEGYAIIRCPDIQQVAEMVAQGKLLDTAYTSPAGPITPLDIMYGHRASIEQGNAFMAHRTAFTLKALKQACIDAGFGMVDGKVNKGAFALSVLALVQPCAQAKFWAVYNQHLS